MHRSLVNVAEVKHLFLSLARSLSLHSALSKLQVHFSSMNGWFIAIAIASALGTAFAETEQKSGRGELPSLSRLMIPDYVNGSRARHDFVYDDEHGRHVTLRYDVERTPGLKLHHLDSRESMIEHVTATNASAGFVLLHFNDSEHARAHPLLHSDLHRTVISGGHRWKWTNSRTRQADPILVRPKRQHTNTRDKHARR